MAALGLHPRIERFGATRIVGVYDVPFFEDVSVVEVIVRMPWWMVDLSEWWPYQPPAWDDEYGIGRPDFYLSEDGQELIGSYLAPPPIRPTTRFAVVLEANMSVPGRLGGRKLRLPDPQPIPERLLRLIWLDR
jgi:hypothetical protein